MCGKIELVGTIGYKNSSARWIESSTGKKTMVFGLWANDFTKPMVEVEGRKRHATSLVQVMVSDPDRADKIMPYLVSGRKVRVTGRLTHRPNVTEIGGKRNIYVNMTVYMDTIDFMSEDPKTGETRVLNKLVSLKAITESQKNTYLAALSETTETESEQSIDPEVPF